MSLLIDDITENSELEKVFHNVSDHLIYEGIFIFDFWYGPAVLFDPPLVRRPVSQTEGLKPMV